MTSVLNLRLQLSGSKYYVLILGLICITFTSCGVIDDLFSDKSGDYTKNKSRKPTPSEKDRNVDTIQVDVVNNPDKVSDLEVESDESRKKDAYTVGLFLPFVSDAVGGDDGKLSYRNEYYMQYYLGAKIAAQKIADKGLNLHLITTDASPDLSKARFKEKIQYRDRKVEYDLIIGGSTRNQIDGLAAFAKEEKCMAIAPFVPHNNVTKNNPYFVQLSPPLEAYLETIVSDISINHSGADVSIIGGEEFTDRFTILQSYKDDIIGESELWNEVVLSSASDLNGVSRNDVFGNGRKQIVIIPMDYNKVFIYDILNHIHKLMNNKEVIVYGLPPWDEYELLYQLFENIEVYMPVMNHIDKNSSAFEKFEEAYYDKYSAIPGKVAIKGYDEFLFIGKMLQKYGIPFSKQLSEVSYKGLSTQFNFNVIKKPSSGFFNDKVDYTENRGLKMEKLSPEDN